jgi:hypothetical protein
MDLSSWGKHGTKWGIFQQAMFDDTRWQITIYITINGPKW